ncbi:MAG: two-component system response regulator [Deltaproteobacteria bacterium RIFCSPLOWO2_02_FULL_50_16]|nr:MAG: two-component system response regulator [Deltaproteobacteria bacterium RIFCSPHIGHO2_02_FULL_50_15]OGQ57147.1 MAG: two-component system response regulator [Deltaproteobacteria bacterium RIFCSPLOWO2_02_FULL_50_16]OGQ68647.1 MAG: two-component system response regulator [Deltaproteobacteria bacterium RIFCSPLOWO2_12_FULL_50_11]
MNKKTILVADDEESLRTIIKNSLEAKDYDVLLAHDGSEAAKLMSHHEVDVALLDIRMPSPTGLELLESIQKKGQGPLVIIMTAVDTMNSAIEAMKRGAFDYLSKPFDLDEMEILVEKALESRALEQEVLHLRQEVKNKYASPQILVGKTRAIQEIYKMIGKVAINNTTVLIQGESGTGKELIARAVHHNSLRNQYPFVPVNVAAIPKDLLESELFGFMKGSFTGAVQDHAGYFEKANRGTLFLDEIGDLPLELQAKLLRVLQDGEVERLGAPKSIKVDVRIVAATHRNLEHLVKAEKFRVDLYYRLNVVPINVPPLRARIEDIPVLTDHFIALFCEEMGVPAKKLPLATRRLLQKYKWPGNVRELENIIKRAIVLSPGPAISPETVNSFLEGSFEGMDVTDLSLEDIIRKKLSVFIAQCKNYDMEDIYDSVIQRVERPLIELILDKTRWNQIQAAKILGINRNTLRKKIAQLKISRHLARGEG